MLKYAHLKQKYGVFLLATGLIFVLSSYVCIYHTLLGSWTCFLFLFLPRDSNQSYELSFIPGINHNF